MHPNPAFRDLPSQIHTNFARERGFGMLALSGDPVPLLAHIPFLLSKDSKTADLHFVRSNPISQAVQTATPATLAVTGADSYISPDWYGIEDQVPTWNYVAVHLSGTLAPLPVDELPDLLARLSGFFEEQLLPKPIWLQEKMDPTALTRMMRMIRPFRLTISDVQGTWKLAQNKPKAARLRAADHVAAYGLGTDPKILAGLMKAPLEKDNP